MTFSELFCYHIIELLRSGHQYLFYLKGQSVDMQYKFNISENIGKEQNINITNLKNT